MQGDDAGGPAAVQRWAGLVRDGKCARLAGLPFAQARREVAAFLAEVGAALPGEVRGLMPDLQIAGRFAASQALVDDLDALHFRLQEDGQQAESDQAFAAARFVSAWVFLAGARSTGDLMDAVYEAWHAQGGEGA